MNKTVKWLGFTLVALLMIFLLVKWMGNRNGEDLRVTTALVKRTTISETVNATGRLYPVKEVRVGAGLSGEVTELLVQEGDAVKKGDVLAKVRTDGNRSSIDLSALTGLSQSVPVGNGSRMVTLKAPFSGIVSVLNGKEGERTGSMAMGGGEVMRIADMTAMELRVDVNENDVIRVKRGDSATVEVDAYPGRQFSGRVTSVATSTQRREQVPFSADVTSYEVRIILDSSGYKDLVQDRSGALPFRSGMNAKADIETRQKQNVLAVPVSAVTSRLQSPEKQDDRYDEEKMSVATGGSEEIVFVVNKQGIAKSRAVKTGIQDMNAYEIVSGLKEGEVVITGPYMTINKLLPEGKKVKIVSRAELYRD